MMRKPVLIRAESAPPTRGRDQAFGDDQSHSRPQMEADASSPPSPSLPPSMQSPSQLHLQTRSAHVRASNTPMHTTNDNSSRSAHTRKQRQRKGQNQHAGHNKVPPSGSLSSSSHGTRKSGKRRHKQRRSTRICHRHALFDASCVAQSRTESVLVSSSGDVLVCRCRRSSTPYINNPKITSPIDQWAGTLVPCCETSDVCGVGIEPSAWSPVFGSPTKAEMGTAANVSRTPHSDITAVTVSDGYSMYEWEKPRLRHGLLGGAMPQPADRNNVTASNRHQPSRADDHMRSQAQDSFCDDTSTEQSTTQVTYAPKESLHTQYSDFDGGIMPLPSFDYNGYENDMVELTLDNKVRHGSIHAPRGMNTIAEVEDNHEEKKEDASSLDAPLEIPQPEFLHGIPTFLSSLSQIRITKVSAHPLGAHVLMISEEAILFTYGLNHHGQLGIGVKSNIKDSRRGFVTEPTIVTPLLENGGKAIQCAAGIDHSLVVVQTEGRRLQKLRRDRGSSAHHSSVNNGFRADGIRSEANINMQRVTSSPCKLSIDDDDSEDDESKLSQDLLLHHQVYGFGNNSYMKLGLVSAATEDTSESENAEDDDSNDVLLPRRVALHCTIWPESALRKRLSASIPSSSMSSASSPLSSMASTQTGYANSSDRPPQGIFELAASTEHSAALVRRATGDVEVYVWGNATLGALGIPVDGDSALPKSDRRRGSRKSKPTAMPTRKADIIFPIPTVLESLSYRPKKDAKVEYPTEISLGPYCSFVVLSSGRCKAFGLSVEGMLGHAYSYRHTATPKEVFLPPQPGESQRPGIVSISAGAHHVIALTEDGKAYAWGINSHSRLGLGSGGKDGSVHPEDEDYAPIEWVPHEVKLDNPEVRRLSGGHAPPKIVRVCAGYDSSIIVLENGQVLSFGKSSGRVGLGEINNDVRTPCPMYGGLRLFAQRKPKPPPRKAPPPSMQRRRSDPVIKSTYVQSAFI